MDTRSTPTTRWPRLARPRTGSRARCALGDEREIDLVAVRRPDAPAARRRSHVRRPLGSLPKRHSRARRTADLDELEELITAIDPDGRTGRSGDLQPQAHRAFEPHALGRRVHRHRQVHAHGPPATPACVGRVLGVCDGADRQSQKHHRYDLHAAMLQSSRELSSRLSATWLGDQVLGLPRTPGSMSGSRFECASSVRVFLRGRRLSVRKPAGGGSSTAGVNLGSTLVALIR